MSSADDSVYTLPDVQEIDGLNLTKIRYAYVFEKRLDDVRLNSKENILLSTYPRTGCTWMSQILSLLLAGEEKYAETKAVPLHQRVLYLERTYYGETIPRINLIDTVPVPRALKTHLPYRFVRRWLQEDKVKAIVTTRNPKDMLVSLFYHYQNVKEFDFNGSWDDFFRHVQAGHQLYGDQYEWLRDWNNQLAQHPHQILVVKYEDMKENVMIQMERIAAFIGIDASANLLERIAKAVTFVAMRDDQAVVKNFNLKNGSLFIRSGEVGGWKKYFTVHQNEWFDAKYKKLYADLDIDVIYQ